MALTGEAGEFQYEKGHINDSHVASLIAATTFTLVIAYSAVLLRLVSRRISRTRLGWDDWTIIMSLAFSTGFAITTAVNITIGYGRHEIIAMDPLEQKKLITAGGIFYTWAILLFKVSALCLLQRIFPGQGYKHFLWTIGAFVLAYSLVQTFVILYTCMPISAIWDPSVKGHCIDTTNAYIVCSSFNIATDVIILALPMPRFWRLNLPKAQRVQLIVFFALGGTVCIISIIRATKIILISIPDTSYVGSLSTAFTGLETAFGTLSACLPTYRPILHHLLGHKSSSGKSERKGTQIHRLIGRKKRRSTQNPFEADAHSVLPLTRLENSSELLHYWIPPIPLCIIKYNTTAERAHPRSRVDRSLGLTGINVVTDLEQISIPKTAVLLR